MLEPVLAFNALRIEALSLSVRLGCTAEERAVPQEVRLAIELRFRATPKGTITDSLHDTICYAKVSEVVKDRCESQEYQLVERMACEIYGLVREVSGPGVEIGVSVHKVRPPVANLLGGTFYKTGDFML